MTVDLIAAASQITADALEDDALERLHHCAAVAAKAEELAATVAASEAEMLVAAAWLHDIGYGEKLSDSGFHPLDGALYLRERGWPQTVCALVAHHSGSRFVARVIGLHHRLSEFEFVEDAVSDALTVADNTAGLNGMTMSLEDRLRDKAKRHGPGTPNARANPMRDDYIRAAAARVDRRLARVRHRGPIDALRVDITYEEPFL